jgi:hypothetical protein
VLIALGPTCAPPDVSSFPDCSAAVHRYCRTLECFASGFGPTPVPGRAWSAVCVTGDVRMTTYAALRALVPACDGSTERIGPSCSTAISRYCASTGAVSGFGPVDTAGDNVTLTCLPRGSVVPTTFATLASFSSGICDGAAERWGPSCGMASSSLCASMGHLSGFGPVEAAGASVAVVCVDP